MSPAQTDKIAYTDKITYDIKNGPVPGTLKKEADFPNSRNYVRGLILSVNFLSICNFVSPRRRP